MKKKYLFSLLVCFYIIVGNSQQKEQSKKSIEEIVFGGSLENQNDLNEIQLIDYKKDNLILFNVKIDGLEHIFLFDTGATISLISDEISKNEEVLSQIPLKDGLGKQKKANIITKKIEISSAFFNNIGFAVIDLNEIRKKTCLKIDGVLGANAINVCNWKINPTEEKIYFSKKSFIINDDDKQSTHNLGFYSKLVPIINISLNKKPIWVAIDTGFSECLKLNTESFDEVKNKVKNRIKKGYGNYFTTINNATNLEMNEAVIDTIGFDNQYFFNLKTLISVDKPSVGAKFLKNYITIFNINDKKISFKEIAKSTNEDYYEFNQKFILNDKNELVLNFLWDDEEISKNDLKLNDIVLSINDINCEKLDLETYCRIKDLLKHSESVSVIFKKNKEKIVILKKKKIFD